MKTTFLVLIATTFFYLSSYADDGPTFVKVGGVYSLTAAPGVTIPARVTIAAAGGGGWFRVTESKETPSGPQPQHYGELGDRWINFNHVIAIREVPSTKGPK